MSLFMEPCTKCRTIIDRQSNLLGYLFAKAGA